MLALNAGMRDKEIRNLQWERLDLSKAYLRVGESKTEASEGRTIPLNSALLQVLVEYSEWYIKRFGPIRPGWYVFPFGKPRPQDPTRPLVTFQTSSSNARTKAKVQGRWHHNSHTLITDLAESGAGDETIRDIAGHVSKQMLKHYSHIRMEAAAPRSNRGQARSTRQVAGFRGQRRNTGRLGGGEPGCSQITGWRLGA